MDPTTSTYGETRFTLTHVFNTPLHAEGENEVCPTRPTRLEVAAVIAGIASLFVGVVL